MSENTTIWAIFSSLFFKPLISQLQNHRLPVHCTSGQKIAASHPQPSARTSQLSSESIDDHRKTGQLRQTMIRILQEADLTGRFTSTMLHHELEVHNLLA